MEKLWPEDSTATQWGDSGALCILEQLLCNINSKELFSGRCKLNRKTAYEVKVNFPS